MTLQSDLCATLVDEFLRAGVRDAVVAPGSRSSLLTLALVRDGRVRVHVRLDERSAAFFALGIAIASHAPVVLVTTSGTAAAEVHGAIAEADLARVPLIVCTADRPVELHDVGAPQTITQRGLYASALRYALDLAAEEATRPYWRSMASRLVVEAAASVAGPGPVHCNLALREPFGTDLGVASPGRSDGAPWHRVVRDASCGPGELAAVAAVVATARRGVIVAGGSGERTDDEVLLALADALRWPVLAEPRALRRRVHPRLIAHADPMLRSDAVADALAPDVVLSLGAPHASRVVNRFLERAGAGGALRVLVDPYGAFADPDRQVDLLVGAGSDALARALGAAGVRAVEPGWSAAWRRADDAAAAAISTAYEGVEQLDEPLLARELFSALPADSVLFASSSMPVRDLEWFAPARDGAPQVYANRGANGIDGITSTALGVAAAASSTRTVAALVGDLAFLYDLSGLVVGAHEPEPDATILVVDNAGGGIFSFLDYAPLLDPAVFERAFGTPQAPDCAAVARALGASVAEVTKRAELTDALRHAFAHRGLDVVVARTSRPDNLDVHAALAAAAASAAEASLAA